MVSDEEVKLQVRIDKLTVNIKSLKRWYDVYLYKATKGDASEREHYDGEAKRTARKILKWKKDLKELKAELKTKQKPNPKSR